MRVPLAAAGAPDGHSEVGVDWLESLNAHARATDVRNDNDRPVRLVPAQGMPARDYERLIHATGNVPTRLHEPDCWHDFFNALMWLALPRIKSRINALHVHALDASCGTPTDQDTRASRRGGLRDRLTVFDENAVLFVTDAPEWAQRLRAQDWPALLVQDRAGFQRHVRVGVIGHALLLKLRTPYKAITGHAWIVTGSARTLEEIDRAGWCTLDASVARSLDENSLLGNRLAPLPVLGIPGWWAANASATFYNDPDVFRPKRRVG